MHIIKDQGVPIIYNIENHLYIILYIYIYVWLVLPTLFIIKVNVDTNKISINNSIDK
jgi:hypothetical protein